MRDIYAYYIYIVYIIYTHILHVTIYTHIYINTNAYYIYSIFLYLSVCPLI